MIKSILHLQYRGKMILLVLVLLNFILTTINLSKQVQLLWLRSKKARTWILLLSLMVQYSVLPWLSFTSNSHARQLSHSDSVPKITFGKLERVEEKLKMPMSVHVNHALMDGYHVGQYVEYFQKLLNQD